jgi:Raf kinase inhibitor-like YbhB/YbcL family protein
MLEDTLLNSLRRLARSAVLAAVAALAVATPSYAGGGMQITSTAFSDGGQIPRVYTCQGADISPPLAWSGVPKKTRSLALILEDPDAPDPAAPQMTWVHWVLYNIPPDTKGLPQGVSRNTLPSGTLQGSNDWSRVGYGGPCPPAGRHRYFFRLYALDIRLPDLKHATRGALEEPMLGHVLAEAELYGTYQKTH